MTDSTGKVAKVQRTIMEFVRLDCEAPTCSAGDGGTGCERMQRMNGSLLSYIAE